MLPDGQWDLRSEWTKYPEGGFLACGRGVYQTQEDHPPGTVLEHGTVYFKYCLSGQRL